MFGFCVGVKDERLNECACALSTHNAGKVKLTRFSPLVERVCGFSGCEEAGAPES